MRLCLALMLLATPVFAALPEVTAPELRPSAQFGDWKKKLGDLSPLRDKAAEAAKEASTKAGLLRQYSGADPAPAPANKAARVASPSVTLEVSKDVLNREVRAFLQREKPRIEFAAPLQGSWLELRDGEISTDPARNLILVKVLNSPASIGLLGNQTSTLREARLELAPRLEVKDGKVMLLADAWLTALDIDSAGPEIDRVAANLAAGALRSGNPVVETDATELLSLRQETEVLGRTMKIDLPPQEASVTATERGLLLEVRY